jgi:hypothetical protein
MTERAAGSSNVGRSRHQRTGAHVLRPLSDASVPGSYEGEGHFNSALAIDQSGRVTLRPRSARYRDVVCGSALPDRGGRLGRFGWAGVCSAGG